jgi:hypothetical protein
MSSGGCPLPALTRGCPEWAPCLDFDDQSQTIDRHWTACAAGIGMQHVEHRRPANWSLID